MKKYTTEIDAFQAARDRAKSAKKKAYVYKDSSGQFIVTTRIRDLEYRGYINFVDE